MKHLFSHKVFSVALSVMVMFSTLSLTIEKQFCGDKLVDVSIFSESDICCSDEVEKKSTETLSESCCKNEVDVVDGLSETTLNSFEDLENIQKQVLFAYTYSIINLFEEQPNLVVPHQNYIPPKLVKDIHILDETYLI